MEWMDLRRLTAYAAVSERTLREWIHRLENPLPAVRVGTKLLVRKSTRDRWLEAHQVRQVDVGYIVEEMGQPPRNKKPKRKATRILK
jgi:excisionase family DNA binding protein